MRAPKFDPKIGDRRLDILRKWSEEMKRKNCKKCVMRYAANTIMGLMKVMS